MKKIALSVAVALLTVMVSGGAATAVSAAEQPANATVAAPGPGTMTIGWG